MLQYPRINAAHNYSVVVEEVWFVEQATIFLLTLTAAFVCARHAGLGSFCMMQARKAVEPHALLPFGLSRNPEPRTFRAAN